MKQRVLLSGNDAVDLLARISTVDPKRLKQPGSFHPALILNAQGKIRVFFEISASMEIIYDPDFGQDFLEVLDQFTFAEKYEVKKLSSPDASFGFASEKLRIEALCPKLGNEFLNNEETNPLEVNLGSAIHENKGCYPGQEVIEKIISLGSPAKRLCLLETDTDFSLAHPLSLFDEKSTHEVGTLTSLSDHAALAIVKRTHLKAGTVFQIQTPTGTHRFTLKKAAS